MGGKRCCCMEVLWASVFDVCSSSVAPLLLERIDLAAGQGVVAANEQALEGVVRVFLGSFGDAGATVVVEEFA